MIISSFSRNTSLTKELLCCDLCGNSLSSEKKPSEHILEQLFCFERLGFYLCFYVYYHCQTPSNFTTVVLVIFRFYLRLLTNCHQIYYMWIKRPISLHNLISYVHKSLAVNSIVITFSKQMQNQLHLKRCYLTFSHSSFSMCFSLFNLCVFTVSLPARYFLSHLFFT